MTSPFFNPTYKTDWMIASTAVSDATQPSDLFELLNKRDFEVWTDIWTLAKCVACLLFLWQTT